ncbi:hypothetical protein O6H91_Y482000 [Diphasiastrum complanatum]|nr:hypothetical protein O6H91_Y482000 [Diphasiastrum complanatum]
MCACCCCPHLILNWLSLLHRRAEIEYLRLRYHSPSLLIHRCVEMEPALSQSQAEAHGLQYFKHFCNLSAAVPASSGFDQARPALHNFAAPIIGDSEAIDSQRREKFAALNRKLRCHLMKQKKQIALLQNLKQNGDSNLDDVNTPHTRRPSMALSGSISIRKVRRLPLTLSDHENCSSNIPLAGEEAVFTLDGETELNKGPSPLNKGPNLRKKVAEKLPDEVDWSALRLLADTVILSLEREELLEKRKSSINSIVAFPAGEWGRSKRPAAAPLDDIKYSNKLANALKAKARCGARPKKTRPKPLPAAQRDSVVLSPTVDKKIKRCEGVQHHNKFSESDQ